MMSTTAPGSILATAVEPPRDEVSSKRVRSFTHGATTAVRRALVSPGVDPARAAAVVADLPPVLEFAQHLHRQPGAPENPGDLIIAARADARVHLIGFEADKSRQRQAGCRADTTRRAILGARRPNGRECTYY